MLEVNAKPEPENLTHADAVAIKDLDDAFTQAQVDNLVAELDDWTSKAMKNLLFIKNHEFQVFAT